MVPIRPLAAESEPGLTVVRVREALEAAGQEAGYQAGIALALAAMLDVRVGRAAEARELDRLMRELTRGSAVSWRDELASRRAAKTGA